MLVGDKKYYDRQSKFRVGFDEGDNANLRKGKVWVPAQIQGKAGLRSYIVKDEENNVYRRNSVDLRKSLNKTSFKDNINFVSDENCNRLDISNHSHSVKENVPSYTPLLRSTLHRQLPVRFKDYHMNFNN